MKRIIFAIILVVLGLSLAACNQSAIGSIGTTPQEVKIKAAEAATDGFRQIPNVVIQEITITSQKSHALEKVDVHNGITEAWCLDVDFIAKDAGNYNSAHRVRNILVYRQNGELKGSAGSGSCGFY